MSKDKQLDSDISPEKQRLRDAIGNRDPDDLNILGYGVMYTVGADWNCIVPRDWLLDRMNDLGLPMWLAPSETSPHYAYDRAMKWMREDWLDPYYIEAPRMDTGLPEDHRVEVELKDGDGSRIWHVHADVFFDEEESKQEGGTWNTHHLGTFHYSKTAKAFKASKDDKLDEDDYLFNVWRDVSSAGEGLFRRMLRCHIAQDIRKMMYNIVTKHTNSVIKLRRSVYLFPAGMEELVESMAQLYGDIDEEWKTTGEPVAIRTFEVMDTDDKQDWIQHQVKTELQDNLDDVLEAAFAEFDEGEAADQVVRIIEENLDNANSTASTYNALLEAEISIEEALSEYKSSISDDEKKEIVETVMGKQTAKTQNAP